MDYSNLDCFNCRISSLFQLRASEEAGAAGADGRREGADRAAAFLGAAQERNRRFRGRADRRDRAAQPDAVHHEFGHAVRRRAEVSAPLPAGLSGCAAVR